MDGANGLCSEFAPGPLASSAASRQSELRWLQLIKGPDFQCTRMRRPVGVGGCCVLVWLFGSVVWILISIWMWNVNIGEGLMARSGRLETQTSTYCMH